MKIKAFTIGSNKSIPSRHTLIRPAEQQTFLSQNNRDEGLYYKMGTTAFANHLNFQDMGFKPSDFSFMKVLRSKAKPKGPMQMDENNVVGATSNAEEEEAAQAPPMN